MLGNVHTLTQEDVDLAAQRTAKCIRRLSKDRPTLVYGVPRGGVPAMYAVMRFLPGSVAVDDPDEADILIDDLVDSGATRDRYQENHPRAVFFALFDKQLDPSLPWLVFPWEGSEQGSIEDSTLRMLQYIGEDPKRDGLLETPGRVARAWKDWTSGYGMDVAKVLKTFEGPSESHDEMVLVRDLPFYSQCEHHMAPFFGTADIAYIPNGRIVGLSKLSRLLDIFARRLQVQERLTVQVADALMEHLGAKGAGVCIRARHLCMESRGIQKQGHVTITNAVRGVLFDDARARAEFMGLIR